MHAIVLCNGQPPELSLLKESLRPDSLFIAADGGGNSARELGFTPDIVIGDMDSYQPRDKEQVELMHIADQETNDLEKALSYALEQNISSVTVLGATGKRLDHSLKNLSVLKQFNHQFDSLVFKDNFGDTRLVPSSFSTTLPVGTVVSLFPLSGRVTGISTYGLKYPLEDEILENGVRDGSSNLVTGQPLRIEYDSGDLILFIAR